MLKYQISFRGPLTRARLGWQIPISMYSIGRQKQYLTISCDQQSNSLKSLHDQESDRDVLGSQHFSVWTRRNGSGVCRAYRTVWPNSNDTSHSSRSGFPSADGESRGNAPKWPLRIHRLRGSGKPAPADPSVEIEMAHQSHKHATCKSKVFSSRSGAFSLVRSCTPYLSVRTSLNSPS